MWRVCWELEKARARKTNQKKVRIHFYNCAMFHANLFSWDRMLKEQKREGKTRGRSEGRVGSSWREREKKLLSTVQQTPILYILGVCEYKILIVTQRHAHTKQTDRPDRHRETDSLPRDREIIESKT
jgi:hypothetical protein